MESLAIGSASDMMMIDLYRYDLLSRLLRPIVGRSGFAFPSAPSASPRRLLIRWLALGPVLGRAADDVMHHLNDHHQTACLAHSLAACVSILPSLVFFSR